MATDGALLEANLAEHEQVARLDDGTVERYSSTARVHGLDHAAPDEKAPDVVAERVRAYLCEP